MENRLSSELQDVKFPEVLTRSGTADALKASRNRFKFKPNDRLWSIDYQLSTLLLKKHYLLLSFLYYRFAAEQRCTFFIVEIKPEGVAGEGVFSRVNSIFYAVE